MSNTTSPQQKQNSPKRKAQPPLNNKQKRFCEEYIIDMNVTQAYIRAGYEPKHADSLACRLMGYDGVKKYLGELIEKRVARTQITADRVIAELALIAFSNAGDLYTKDGALKNISSMPENVTRAIQEVTSRDDEILKIKTYDKKGALDSLGKHFGIFERDNAQSRPEAIVKITRKYV